MALTGPFCNPHVQHGGMTARAAGRAAEKQAAAACKAGRNAVQYRPGRAVGRCAPAPSFGEKHGFLPVRQGPQRHAGPAEQSAPGRLRQGCGRRPQPRHSIQARPPAAAARPAMEACLSSASGRTGRSRAAAASCGRAAFPAPAAMRPAGKARRARQHNTGPAAAGPFWRKRL